MTYDLMSYQQMSFTTEKMVVYVFLLWFWRVFCKPGDVTETVPGNRTQVLLRPSWTKDNQSQGKRGNFFGLGSNNSALMLHCKTDARMLLVTVLQPTTAWKEILIVSEVRLLLRPTSTNQPTEMSLVTFYSWALTLINVPSRLRIKLWTYNNVLKLQRV